MSPTSTGFPRHEVGFSRHRIGPRHGCQKKTPRRQEIDQVFPSCKEGFRRLFMRYERVGRNRQQLIKNVKRDKIPRKGHAHSSENGQAETAVVPGLSMFFKCPKVPDGVDRHENPEKRRCQGEKKAESIDAQEQSPPPGKMVKKRHSTRAPLNTAGIKGRISRNWPRLASKVHVSRRLGLLLERTIRIDPKAGQLNARRGWMDRTASITDDLPTGTGC